jgi:hypothetical protein
MRKRILISLLFIPVLGFVIYAPFLEGLLFFIFIMLVSLLASLEVHSLSAPLVIHKPERGHHAWERSYL